MKRWQGILIICVLSLGAFSQDMHFTQYIEQPALLNPALTGAVTNLRASLVHKKQWGHINTPYTTYGASFEIRSPGRYKRTGRFGRTKTRTQGLLAMGISAYRDNAGDGKMSSTYGNLNFASFIPAGKRNFFSLGLQASLVQKQIDLGSLVFPDQFTGSGYDPTALPGEDIPNQAFQYADFSAGFLWAFGSNIKTFLYHHETKARVGFSVYHLTKPTQQYFNQTVDYLNHKYVGHGEFLRDIEGTHFAWTCSFIGQVQGAAKEITLNSMIKFYNSNDTKITGYVRRSTFGVGAGYRYNDAVILQFQAELEEQYAFGFSWDITVSSLKSATKRGGLEMTFRYTPANSYLYQRKK